MPAIEEPDPELVNLSGGLTSYGVAQLIINQLLGGLQKKDLELLASYVHHRIDNYPTFWKNHFARIEDVFTDWEKLALEQGSVVPVIRSIRGRLGWGLRESKEATDYYKDALNKGEIEPIKPRTPRWEREEDPNPNNLITSRERRLVSTQLDKTDSLMLINPEDTSQQYQLSFIDSVMERTHWPMIEAKILFDVIARRMRNGEIARPSPLLTVPDVPVNSEYRQGVANSDESGGLDIAALKNELL